MYDPEQIKDNNTAMVLLSDWYVTKNTSYQTGRSNLTLWLGAAMVFFVAAMGIVSLFWTPYNPVNYISPHILQGSTSSHLLGTDQEGRDELSRLMAGAWITVYSGLLATFIGIMAGSSLGIYVAIGRRGVSEAIMRLSDILLAFPALLLATLISVRYGSSTLTAVLAIGIAFIPYVTRVTRVNVIKVYKSDYVLTARAYGLGKMMTVKRHILPNILPVLTVQTMLLFSVAVLSEAGLSYLGLGTPPPSPAWGDMLSEAQSVILTDPLLVLWPTLAIAVTVLGFNLLAEGILAKTDARNR